MLDPIKVLAHFLLQRVTDKIRAAAGKIAKNGGRTTSKMVIKLPPGEYQYTLEEISGHPSVNLFLHSFDNTTGDTHTTIFCLFDLMVKILDNGTRFSTKAILVNDNECD
jgi:hypothetical protein